MDVILASILLVIILGLIVLICILFTNAIEHFGCRLNLSQGAIGSILAAVGTALPETIVPIVAIAGSYILHTDLKSGEEIGIGAILGAPFLLGTLAFFITGLAVYIYSNKGKRTLEMPVNTSVMKRDIKYFWGCYIIAVLASFIHIYFIKVIIALGLLFCYGRYVYLTIADKSNVSNCDSELEELYLARFFPDNLQLVVIQMLLSVLGIIFLAHFFVVNLETVSHALNISPLLLSLIVAPIATELPEKFNSVIWIKAKKDTLALGNITGAMVFQSSIPTAIGLLITPWIINFTGLISVLLVIIASVLVYINIVLNKGVLKPWTLLLSGLFYLFYIIFLYFTVFMSW